MTISVSDNGKGIPDPLKTKIFDPFYQIKFYEANKGTGIGLSLAKHLSDILGGTIAVEDNPGGALFLVFTFNELPESKSVIDYRMMMKTWQIKISCIIQIKSKYPDSRRQP